MPDEKIPRPLSLVKQSKEWNDDVSSLPKDAVFVFWGEFANLGGHCIVQDRKTQKFYIGFHTERFVELTEEEL